MTLSPNAQEFIPVTYTTNLIPQPVQTFLVDPQTGTTSPIIIQGFPYTSQFTYYTQPNQIILSQPPGQYYYPYQPIPQPQPQIQSYHQPKRHKDYTPIREPYIADEKIFNKVVKNVNFIKQTVEQHYNYENRGKYSVTQKDSAVFDEGTRLKRASVKDETNNKQFMLNENDFPELSAGIKTNEDRHSDAYSSDTTVDANQRLNKSQTSDNQNSSSTSPRSKKINQPLTIEFANMITALQNGQQRPRYLQPGAHVRPQYLVNHLDPNSIVKRGKELESKTNKKKSTLKKIILREREEKRKQRDDGGKLNDTPNLSKLFSDDKDKENLDIETDDYTDIISPISQASPLSYNPSPYAALISNERLLSLEKLEEQVKQKIHSKKFREYCNQIVNLEIDGTCTSLLNEIVRFQDRLYQKNPIKAKMKRRYVMGIREVTKHLKLQKLKCVILAPNCEKIESKGGLDDAINFIIQTSMQQNIPFLFALGRKGLGKAVNKLVPISVIGIFDYSGAEEHFKRLVELANNAKLAYQEMVEEFEREECENLINTQSNLVNTLSRPETLDPLPSSTGPLMTNQIFPKIPSHMAHSRTPSNGSNISIDPIYHMNYHTHSRSASGTFNYGHTSLVNGHARTPSGGGGINLDMLVNNKSWTHSRTPSNASNISFISRMSEPISEVGGNTYSAQAAVQFYADQVRLEMKQNEDESNNDETENQAITESLGNLHLGCINEIDAGNEADTEDLEDKNKVKQSKTDN